MRAERSCNTTTKEIAWDRTWRAKNPIYSRFVPLTAMERFATKTEAINSHYFLFEFSRPDQFIALSLFIAIEQSQQVGLTYVYTR
jgi:hypothetical protein